MLKKYLLIMFLTCCNIYAHSQSNFDEYIDKANIFVANGEYLNALEYCDRAIQYAPNRDREVFLVIERLINLLSEQREYAIEESSFYSKKATQLENDLSQISNDLEQTKAALTDFIEKNSGQSELIEDLSTIKSNLETRTKSLEGYNAITQSRKVALETKELNNTDTKLKSQLALKCYMLNSGDVAGGDISHHNIFEALFEAYSSINNKRFDLYTVEDVQKQNVVRDLHITNNKLFACTSKGHVIAWTLKDTGGLEGKNTIVSQPESIRKIVAHEYSQLTFLSPFFHQTHQLDGGNTLEKVKSPLGINDAVHIEDDFWIAADTHLYTYNNNTKTAHKELDNSVKYLFNYNNRIGFLTHSGIAYSYEVGEEPKELTDLYGYTKFRENISYIITHNEKKYVAYGSLNGDVILDMQKVKINQNLHRSKISTLEFSPDGKWMACASFDGSISIWNLDKVGNANYKPYHLKDFGTAILCIAFDKNNGVFLGLRNGSVQYINLDSRYYAVKLCDKLNLQKIDEQVWQSFFGKEITQPQNCN